MLGLALGGVSRADDTPKQRASAVLEAAARDGFSGTVCVESGGATLVDSAFGWADDRHSRRVDPDTLYHVASVTKLVTAIAVLKLAEQRKLALADPVGKWFPEAPPDKAAITIKQLLLHQSGLGQNYAADGIASRDVAVRAVLATALSFPPGTAQKYSNDGMNLVAAVIEKASGRSYRDFVHDEILAPAGLKRSLLWEEVNPRKTQNLAVPAAGAATGPAAGRNWGLMGGDGFWSNARELTRLMRAVVGGRILRPESVKALSEPRFDSQDGDFTNLGWFTRVEPRQPRLLWIRGTEQNGFNAALYWYPDADLILAITTNLGPFESGRVTVSRALANRLEQALLPARAPDASGRAQHQDRVRAAEAERVGQR
jgi:CubicO group peptidase (beta-lactamase class C family)